MLKRGQTFIDVGAHFGYESLLASRLVGNEGSVISFEPNPETYAIARLNLAGCSNVELRQQGVGSAVGSLKCECRPISQSAFNQLGATDSGYASIDVSVTCLDAVLESKSEKVAFIKCDAEGMEIDILRGATRVLKNDKPLIVLEGDLPTNSGMSSPRTRELAEYMKGSV